MSDNKPKLEVKQYSELSKKRKLCSLNITVYNQNKDI